MSNSQLHNGLLSLTTYNLFIGCMCTHTAHTHTNTHTFGHKCSMKTIHGRRRGIKLNKTFTTQTQFRNVFNLTWWISQSEASLFAETRSKQSGSEAVWAPRSVWQTVLGNKTLILRNCWRLLTKLFDTVECLWKDSCTVALSQLFLYCASALSLALELRFLLLCLCFTITSPLLAVIYISSL